MVLKNINLKKLSSNSENTSFWVEGSMTKLECPFCGGEVKIQVCDDEGNFQDEEYEKAPWSGLSYTLTHYHEDNPKCPIATYATDGVGIGVILYETREEAINTWNRRYNS